MKRLSHSVNIVPVIAKADTMTIEERQEFKQRVSFSSLTKLRMQPAVPLINAVFLKSLLKKSAATGSSCGDGGLLPDYVAVLCFR